VVLAIRKSGWTATTLSRLSRICRLLFTEAPQPAQALKWKTASASGGAQSHTQTRRKDASCAIRLRTTLTLRFTLIFGVEDYLIFHVDAFTKPVSIPEISTRYGQRFAQILRAESRELSEDEVTDALSHRISFAKKQ
jgi:hypothetical protein